MTVYWVLDTTLLVLFSVYFLYYYLWPNGRLPSRGRKWGIGVECEIWLELVIKTPQRCQWRRFGVFVVCFGHVSRFFVLFPFLALGM